MSDIVARLRANMDKYPGFENMNTEAAAEIERLRELVAFNEDQRRMLFDAANKLEAERKAMLDDLDTSWSFDNDQTHTHTWHAKQDFLEKWAATDAAGGGEK